MNHRSCSKVTCGRTATSTLTYDYGSSVAAIGPLSPSAEADAYDLCQRHADAFTPPGGWQVLRHHVDDELPAPAQLNIDIR